MPIWYGLGKFVSEEIDRELKKEGRRRLRNRHLKREFELPKTL